jgi:hypothetical protein
VPRPPDRPPINHPLGGAGRPPSTPQQPTPPHLPPRPRPDQGPSIPPARTALARTPSVVHRLPAGPAASRRRPARRPPRRRRPARAPSPPAAPQRAHNLARAYRVNGPDPRPFSTPSAPAVCAGNPLRDLPPPRRRPYRRAKASPALPRHEAGRQPAGRRARAGLSGSGVAPSPAARAPGPRGGRGRRVAAVQRPRARPAPRAHGRGAVPGAGAPRRARRLRKVQRALDQERHDRPEDRQGARRQRGAAPHGETGAPRARALGPPRPPAAFTRRLRRPAPAAPAPPAGPAPPRRTRAPRRACARAAAAAAAAAMRAAPARRRRQQRPRPPGRRAPRPPPPAAPPDTCPCPAPLPGARPGHDRARPAGPRVRGRRRVEARLHGQRPHARGGARGGRGARRAAAADPGGRQHPLCAGGPEGLRGRHRREWLLAPFWDGAWGTAPPGRAGPLAGRLQAGQSGGACGGSHARRGPEAAAGPRHHPPRPRRSASARL